MINHPTSAAGFFLRIAVILLFTFLFFRIAILYRNRNESEDSKEPLSGELKQMVIADQVSNTTLSLKSTSATFSRVLDNERSVLKSIWGSRNATLQKVSMPWDEFLKMTTKVSTSAGIEAGKGRETFTSSLRTCPNDEILLKEENLKCKNVSSLRSSRITQSCVD
ncbi:hypothetical protein EON65_15860 [archaeon]|nr:MAG: hypothetical protein EON65_15860 [archaeon]